MAEKESTVYIVDVGASMGSTQIGRDVSDLDFAMTYIWDKITSTVALDRKTATLGVVGLRTDDTENELSHEESFEHISVLHEISNILLPDLKELRSKIVLSSTDNGDAISAIVIAIQMIIKYCKKLKYKRKIVLVTDGRGSLDADPDSVQEITNKIKQDNMELVIVGVDFDDAEFGFKEEDKDPQKAKNEQIFAELAESCGGIFGTLQQAVEELGMPRLKTTRPVHSYKDQLTLGDPVEYHSAACIDVERYPRTMVRRPMAASRFVQKQDPTDGSTSSTGTVVHDGDIPMPDADGNELAGVKSSRTYQVLDEGAPGGKRDVDRDDLAKGYEYGRTAVHINESDENVTKLETQKKLEIIGFIPWANYDRFMSMTVSSVLIAQRTNSISIMALSSLIHALFELESYAIARLVAKEDNPPLIILLAPSIEVDYECLLDVQIPFAEDVRSYKFPPLDRVVTISGKVIKEHRNLPDDALSSAMSKYVDQMDLSTFGRDDDGNPSEYMPMTDTFSPVLHRIDQAVRWRAVHPTEPVPPPHEILVRYSNPPEELVNRSKKRLGKLMAAADVKKVPPKVQGRRRNRNEVKPLSGLNVEALLGGDQKKAKVSAQNAIPDFKRLLDSAESIDALRDAAQQLGKIIEGRIKDSFGNIAYARALDEIKSLREEMTEMEEPALFNDFARQLKRKLLAEELGGNRKDFWWEFRKSKLGLVDKKATETSDATEEDAKSVSYEPLPPLSCQTTTDLISSGH
ncbi:ATP-dependent DNA helicase yku80, variant 2 [Xanthoria parietina]